jgi:hypothetical protein
MSSSKLELGSTQNANTQKKKRLGLERFGHIQVSTHTVANTIAHSHDAA